MKVRAIHMICVKDLTWTWSVLFPLEDIICTPCRLAVIFIVTHVANSRFAIYRVLLIYHWRVKAYLLVVVFLSDVASLFTTLSDAFFFMPGSKPEALVSVPRAGRKTGGFSGHISSCAALVRPMIRKMSASVRVVVVRIAERYELLSLS